MNKKAVRNATISGLTLVLTGEILGMIAAVSVFYSFLSWLIWFSFAAVACCVIEFIGFIILSKGNTYFKRASFIVVLNLLLSIASAILTSFFSSNEICLSLGAIFSAIIVFFEILVVMTTINGCRVAVQGNVEGEYGKTTSYIYTASVVISVVLTLLTNMELLTDSNVIGVIAGIGTFFSELGAILFVILLFRTVGHLKKQAAAEAVNNK